MALSRLQRLPTSLEWVPVVSDELWQKCPRNVWEKKLLPGVLDSPGFHS